MAKTKRDFSGLTALISSGASEIEGRRLSVVPTSNDQPPTVAEAPMSMPSAAAAMPSEVQRAQTQDAPLESETVAAGPEPVAAPAAAMRKLTLQLTEETVLALYPYQSTVRSRPGTRPADTTLGWVADTLLRQALGLSAV